MIKKIIIQIFIIFYLAIVALVMLHAEEGNFKIVKLVNEKIITNYDLQQRLKLYSILNNISINNDNIEEIASKKLSEMIDEILQLEQIEKYNIAINTIDVDEYIKRKYLRDQINLEEFKLIFKENNLDFDIFIKFIEIKLGWNDLTGRLYYRTSEINPIDLENLLNKDISLSKEEVENLLLQKQISLRAEKLLRDIRIEATIENR